MSFSDARSASVSVPSSIGTGSQIATVVANGFQYSNWLTVEVSRSHPDVFMHVRLTVAEPGVGLNGGSGPSALQLWINDQVQVYLGGILVMDGSVSVRQAAYSAEEHAVEIIIFSQAPAVGFSSVDGVPGQYSNNNLQQIGSACFGKVGVNFTIAGNPPGADKIFPRISEQIGETRFQFIELLCRMRNLHMIEDGQGGVVAQRQASATVSTQLIEGMNILKAHMVARVDEQADYMAMVAQQPLNNQNWTLGPSSFASTTVSGGPPNRPVTIAAPTPGDNQDCAMGCNHMRDIMLFGHLDCTVTVQGWFLDDGSLWINHVWESVTINSPMLFGPNSPQTLLLKGVVHKQSNEGGTTTDLLLTIEPGGEYLATNAGATPPPVNIGVSRGLSHEILDLKR